MYNKNWTAVLLTFLIGLGMFLSDLYAPSLPAISHALAASTNLVKFSISAYLLGYALPQLVFGPGSDKFGRRPILIFGALLALFGSAICLLAMNIHVLIIGRFIQGLGAAACLPICRVVATDLFQGKQLAKIGSYMGMVFSLVPAIAPVIGGYIQIRFGWHGNFVVMIAMVLLSLLLILFMLPETVVEKNPNALNLRHLLTNYWALLQSKTFLGYTLCSSLAMSAMMVYASMGPFLLQNQLHLSPVMYGWISLVILMGYIVGKYINTQFIHKFGIRNMVLAGNWMMLVSALVMFAFAIVQVMNLWVIVLPILFYLIGTGTVMPNAMAGAFVGFGHIRGFAAALYGFLQIAGTFLVTLVTSSLHEMTQLPLAIIFLVMALTAIILFHCMVSKNEKL